MAIPVHHHDAETEAFHVADGAVTVLVGEEEVPAEQVPSCGSPPGVDHAFRFEADGRMLLFTGGVGHEGLFREIGEPAVSRTIPRPPEDAPDPEQMAALAARFGTTIVGPPFARDGVG